MIGSLRGTLTAKRPPWLTLDVGGVGYELEAPMSTFYRLPDAGREVMLVTHLVVREDAHLLYGFFTEAERALFRSMIKISGIGPKVALGVLSGMSVEGFHQCIRDNNTAGLVKIPGVGPKTAEMLMLKMKDRLPELLESERTALPSRTTAEGEASGALIALGYKPGEVVKMLKDLDSVKLSTEEMIREALRRVHRVAER
jgi:Holliday junction DNA helicase RuvA